MYFTYQKNHTLVGNVFVGGLIWNPEDGLGGAVWDANSELWEVGLKYAINDDLLLTFAVYHQERVRQNFLGTAPDNLEVKGFEMDVTYQPGERFWMVANFTYQDATLIDFAARKPLTLDDFADCHGVGEKKLESFGQAFLEIVTASPVILPHPARRKLAGDANGGLFDALVEAQAGLAHGDTGADRYLACTPSTLAKIAEARPRDLAGLERVSGVGALKAERFGETFLACIRAAEG